MASTTTPEEVMAIKADSEQHEQENEQEHEQDVEMEDEEEVELFSADALALPSPFMSRLAAAAMNGRLVLSPRRCVSRELLDQMPALSISARYFEVSITKPFGVFHLMQLIEKSIQVGALFSPKLYVPKEIWQQNRVKLAGVPAKLEVFQGLKHGIEKITMLLPLSSVEAKTVVLKEFDQFFEFAKSERVHLARSFPFIAMEKPPHGSGHGTKTETQLPASAPPPPSPANVAAAGMAGIGKLTNLAVGFGRMVKKQAIAAVERVGAAQAIPVSLAELEEYAATLCLIFNSTRNLEHLVGLRAAADGTQEEVNTMQTAQSLDADVMARLRDLAIFLDEVVVELVMRDVQSLLETYLRRTTQHFGEFTVEQALLKQQQYLSSSVSA